MSVESTCTIDSFFLVGSYGNAANSSKAVLVSLKNFEVVYPGKISSPGSGIGWIDFPSVNVPRGITHLQLMKISYLIVSSPEVVGEVVRD